MLSQPGSSRSILSDPQRDIDTIIVDDDFIEKTVYLQKIELTLNGKSFIKTNSYHSKFFFTQNINHF